MIDLWLLVAKYVFLVLMYVFVFWALAVIRHESDDAEVPVLIPTARIHVVDGMSTRRSHDIGDAALIGRGQDCDVQLDDSSVSTRHAKISKRGRHWMVEDLGSSNGTFVNGGRIEGVCRLKPGDRITIGRTELTVDES